MPTLYGVNASPFVRKVRVVLAEKEIPYDHEVVIPGMAPEGYRKLHPMGKIPAFRDGGKTLADSSVICAYLERTHPSPALYPSEPYEFARALWFEEYADTALPPVLGGQIFFQKVVRPLFFQQPTDENVVKQGLEAFPALFDYLEGELDGKQWLAGGSFSIADIGVASQIVNFRHAGYDVDAKRWPKLAAHAGKVHGRPSFAALIEEEKGSFRGQKAS